MLINFFIVGAPKAGTTSLHYYLDQHPDICMSSIKEPNYFSASDISDLYYGTQPVDVYDEYLALFSGENKVLGEASVSYLYYEGVAARIAAYNPEAKILIVLRNPTDRAFSHFSMDSRLGFCNVELAEIFDRPEEHPLYYRQFISLGNYSNQVRRYLDVFDAKNIKICLYEDLKTKPEFFVDELFSFLNLTSIEVDFTNKNKALVPKNKVLSTLYQQPKFRSLVTSVLPENILDRVKKGVFTRGSELRTVDEEMYNRLRSYYAKEIDSLRSLTGLEFLSW